MNNKQLISELKTIFGEKAYRDLKITVDRTSSSSLNISVAQMYEYVEVSFDVLEKLGNLLNTKNISIGDKENWGGCETCDYGSSYTVSFCVKEIGIELTD